MKLIRRILVSILLLLLVVALFQNQESLGTLIPFTFLKWTFGMVLGFWIFFALVAGALLFAVVSAWKNFRMRREIRKRDQEIARLEHALAVASKATGTTGQRHPGDEPLK